MTSAITIELMIRAKWEMYARKMFVSSLPQIKFLKQDTRKMLLSNKHNVELGTKSVRLQRLEDDGQKFLVKQIIVRRPFQSLAYI